MIFCECAHSLVNVQKASPSNPPPALNPTSPAVICVFNYTVAAAGTRRVFSLDIKVLRVAISCLNTWEAQGRTLSCVSNLSVTRIASCVILQFLYFCKTLLFDPNPIKTPLSLTNKVFVDCVTMQGKFKCVCVLEYKRSIIHDIRK